MEIVGLEIAGQDSLYLWRKEASDDAWRCIVFPDDTYEQIPLSKMWQGVDAALTALRPAVIATNGYSSRDAWAVLTWGRLHRCPAVLMTESKVDDAPRSRWKERLKVAVVHQYDSALCGGGPHRRYLEQLGMRPDRIFEGYDVVDNDYFWRCAQQVRQNPAAYRSLPGLEPVEPLFLAVSRFVKRKNLGALLRAYARYRRQVTSTGGGAPWRLVVLGDGEERSALNQLVCVEGIEGVSFPGFRQIDELPAYYGLASVFIHPAYQEQWGLVVNEAMAAGLPVLVSCRCGCAPDLVAEGQNGFTFPPDDVEALSDLMARVSSGQVDLGALGRASRDRISRWDLDRFGQGLGDAVAAALREQADA